MKSQLQKCAIASLAIVLIVSASSDVLAQDLFKKGGLSDAFSSKSGENTNTSVNRSGYTFEKMEKFVLDSKFKDAKKVTERAYRFTYTYNDWTLPTVLEISKSQTNLWVTMILKYPKVDLMDHPDRMLKLLEWNGSYGDSFFSIIPSSKAITLVGALQLNGPVEDKDIKKQLEYVASLSVRTQELWDTTKWSDAPKYVGKWVGEDGNKMTVELERSGKFTLTSGTGSVTKGMFTIGEGTIELTETTDSGAKGEKISGKIEFTDANHFVLEVGGNKLKFVRK